MRTLKELVAWQDITKQDDLQTIKTWFVANDMELEGIEIITELSKRKAEKLQNILYQARAWLPVLPNLEKSNSNLTQEQAEKLQSIITIHLLGMDLKGGGYYEWAKEEIPKMKCPTIFFVPCIEWLDKKYGIKFKGE